METVKKTTEGESKKKDLKSTLFHCWKACNIVQRPLQAFLICLSCLSFPAQIQLHHTSLHFILHPYNLPFLEAGDDRQDEWAPLASCIRKQSGPVSQDAGSYMTPFIKRPPPVYSRLFLNLCLISISVVHQIS